MRSGVKGYRLRQERRRGVDRIEEGKLEQMRWFYRGCNYLLKGVLVGWLVVRVGAAFGTWRCFWDECGQGGCRDVSVVVTVEVIPI